MGELYSSRYTELSLNQPINKPNNQHAPSKSISTTFSNISKPILSLSLSLTCRKHTGNILSLHTHLLSLFFSSLSSSFSFFPEKIGRQLHDFTLIFLDFFCFFLSYSLLVWVSMICLILSFFFKFNNDLQAKLPRVFPQSLIVHFRYPTHRGSLTFFFTITNCMEQQPDARVLPSPLTFSSTNSSSSQGKKDILGGRVRVNETIPISHFWSPL